MSTMHQNLFAAAARFAPLRGVLRHLSHLPRLTLTRRDVHLQPATPVRARPAGAASARIVRPAPARRPVVPAGACQRPALLRVIHIMEPGPAAAPAARLLMSGRMADVCAELDRMVEREAAQLARCS